MSLLDAILHRLKPLRSRRDFDRELDDEFRHHLELHAQEFPDGNAPAARARARFGSTAYYKEETRRMTSLAWLEGFRQDLKYAWRNLLRAPVFTATAVLSLGVAIGANAAIFGLLYALLLQPLPVSHPEQLVLVTSTGGRDLPGDAFSYDQYRALRDAPGSVSVSGFTGMGRVPVVAGDARGAADVDGVDGGYFATIGLRPALGRFIAPQDERTRAPVVVVSDAIWAQLFNRAPSAIGRTITIGGASYTVIGVTPADFHGLSFPGSFDLAVPLGTFAMVGGPDLEGAESTQPRMQIVGRMADPSARPRVAPSLDAAYQACCAAAGASRGGGAGSVARHIGLYGIERGKPSVKYDVEALFGRMLFMLLAAAGVVLLAACANVGSLLLARAAARRREMAVRLSLGASRRRLVRQLLTESVVLAALGTGAGLALANWGMRLLSHNLPGEFAPVRDRVAFQFNGTILAFTAAVAAACVVLFGALPAWRSTRTDLVAPLTVGGRSAGARRSGLLDRGVVAAQVALALVLVNSAALLVDTLHNLRNVDAGFSATGAVTAWLDTRGTPYEGGGIPPLAEELLARVSRIPGVRSAALSASLPIVGGRRLAGRMSVEGYAPRAGEDMEIGINAVTPGFFATAGIALRAGRDFGANDRAAGAQVAIANEAFVHKYFAGRDPLGATLRSERGADTIAMRIVGVAGDARYDDVRSPAAPMVYVPLAQFGPLPVIEVTARASGGEESVAAQFRRTLTAVAPGIGIGTPTPIEQEVNSAFSRERLTAALATLFATVALGLSAIGLYGLVSYGVTQRTQEIGVRMALGARPRSVTWLVLRSSLVPVLCGVAVGAPLTFASGRLIGAELFGVNGLDPLFLAGTALLLAGVAMAASVVPARRAARVDPLIALRAD